MKVLVFTMVFGGIVLLIVGLLLSSLSIMLCVGKINLLHSYHRDKVEKMNIKKYGLSIGLSLLLSGIVMTIMGILALIYGEAMNLIMMVVILFVSLIASSVLATIFIYKYNRPEQKKIIKTKRLVLKPLEDKDKDDFINIVLDPKVKKTYMLPDLVSEEDKLNFFNRIKKATEDKERYIYGVFLDNKVIGFVNEVEKIDKEIEVGYFLDSHYWNQGYATEVLTTSIKELFKLGYTCVIAGYFEGNDASGRVMEKSGMHKIDKIDMIKYRDKEYKTYYYEIRK